MGLFIGEHSGEMPQIMKLFSGLGKIWGRIFSSGQQDLNKSRLVGMYLSQTNSKDGYTSELQQNRQRRNGKYSHTRERA
ncbi:MAG: hypothetical protein SFY81_02360 [Verrucomicrobiota bacterium]|nr:hypothetical protein [Verrucomicrobiota bacterium]